LVCGRAVGIAGGGEKCRSAVEVLGFEACVNCRGGDLRAFLKDACPGGIDVYFDNVGGDRLAASAGRVYGTPITCPLLIGLSVHLLFRTLFGLGTRTFSRSGGPKRCPSGTCGPAIEGHDRVYFL
jgi:NADPH:quinone reductase-like Zn-dependent oxidoreductase